MTRLNISDSRQVPVEAQAVLDQVGGQFGFVPAMFQTLATNPAVLDVVMTLQAKSSRFLDAKTRHTIALALSAASDCDYCSALHGYTSSVLGGMSSDDIDLARAADSTDPKRGAAARFAQRVIETRGKVSDAEITAIRNAGYTDKEILSIITVATQTLLTNLINNVNQTTVDIPDPRSDESTSTGTDASPAEASA